jgi:hypothetical protein
MTNSDHQQLSGGTTACLKQASGAQQHLCRRLTLTRKRGGIYTASFVHGVRTWIHGLGGVPDGEVVVLTSISEHFLHKGEVLQDLPSDRVRCTHHANTVNDNQLLSNAASSLL